MAWKLYLLVYKTVLAMIDSKNVHIFWIFIPNVNNEAMIELNTTLSININNNKQLEKVYILLL